MVRDKFETRSEAAMTLAETHCGVSRCYLDIGIGNRYAGRVILGLYSDTVSVPE